MTPEFRRLVMRAQLCLSNVGIVQAHVDAGVIASMGEWRQLVADLG
jgi:hypothetical protein